MNECPIVVDDNLQPWVVIPGTGLAARLVSPLPAEAVARFKQEWEKMVPGKWREIDLAKEEESDGK